MRCRLPELPVFSQQPSTPFQFGEWIVDQDDAAEVVIYRGSLVVAALAVAAAASMALLPGLLGFDEAPAWAFDASAAVFFASFGVSLSTIHIYMKPMHNFLKALWAAGAAGALLVLAISPSHSLVVESFEVRFCLGRTSLSLSQAALSLSKRLHLGLLCASWSPIGRWEGGGRGREGGG